MNKNSKLRRTAALTMSAALLLGGIPVCAVDDGVKPTFDEAYYATTDYYGNLTEGSVVKSYRTNGVATLTDYGEYDEIINLTDGTAPTVSNGKTVFELDEDNVPKTFYFEGKTARPFEELPWTLSVHYALNGVTMKAEELAGKTGMVEITMDAMPNLAAGAYARNNYTLEAMAIFNQDDILSLEAPGAQVQLIGNLRAVLFIGLPGEECHFTIRVGSEDFAFGGMTFLMVPATLSQLEEIARLSERKDDLEENYNKLSGSMDTLLDAMSAMTGSLNASAAGLDQLNQARDIFSNGKGTLYAGTDALRADLSNLAEVLEPVEDQITALSKTISASKSTLNSMVDTVADLRDDLEDAEDALSDLEDGTGDMKRVLTALGNLKKSLNALQTALGGQADDTTDGEDGQTTSFTVTVNQVKAAHSAYVKTDRADFYQAMLELNGSSSQEAETKAAQAAAAVVGLEQVEQLLAQYSAQLEACEKAMETAEGTELEALKQQQLTLKQTLTGLESKKTELEGTIQTQGIDKLESAYQGKAGMTFQLFCQKVLGQSAATAKQMNDLWLVYASGKVEYKDGDGNDTGNTPENGGTLSGELLHRDPEPGTDSTGGTGGSSTDGSTSSDSAGSSSSDGSTSSDSAGGSTTDGNTSSGGEGTPSSGDAGEGSTDSDGASETPETPETPEKPLDSSESVGGAAVDLIAGGLDSAMEELTGLRRLLTQTMNQLKTPTAQVVGDLAALCGRLADLTDLLDDAEDLSAAVRHASADLRGILSDVEDLQDTLNDYEPVLQETLETVSDLSTSAVKTIRDTEKLVGDTETLMRSTGSVLDDGTRETLAGLAAVLRSTAVTMSTAGDLREAKSNICDIIEDTWNEYTGETNNLLLMDATAAAVSLTDARNDAPQSVQVLIRTQEIQKAGSETEETATQEQAQTTFWQRVAQMFRDFWNAVTGIFGGKD